MRSVPDPKYNFRTICIDTLGTSQSLEQTDHIVTYLTLSGIQAYIFVDNMWIRICTRLPIRFMQAFFLLLVHHYFHYFMCRIDVTRVTRPRGRPTLCW